MGSSKSKPETPPPARYAAEVAEEAGVGQIQVHDGGGGGGGKEREEEIQRAKAGRREATGGGEAGERRGEARGRGTGIGQVQETRKEDAVATPVNQVTTTTTPVNQVTTTTTPVNQVTTTTTPVNQPTTTTTPVNQPTTTTPVNQVTTTTTIPANQVTTTIAQCHHRTLNVANRIEASLQLGSCDYPETLRLQGATKTTNTREPAHHHNHHHLPRQPTHNHPLQPAHNNHHYHPANQPTTTIPVNQSTTTTTPVNQLTTTTIPVNQSTTTTTPVNQLTTTTIPVSQFTNETTTTTPSTRLPPPPPPPPSTKPVIPLPPPPSRSPPTPTPPSTRTPTPPPPPPPLSTRRPVPLQPPLSRSPLTPTPPSARPQISLPPPPSRSPPTPPSTSPQTPSTRRPIPLPPPPSRSPPPPPPSTRPPTPPRQPDHQPRQEAHNRHHHPVNQSTTNTPSTWLPPPPPPPPSTRTPIPLPPPPSRSPPTPPPPSTRTPIPLPPPPSRSPPTPTPPSTRQPIPLPPPPSRSPPTPTPPSTRQPIPLPPPSSRSPPTPIPPSTRPPTPPSQPDHHYHHYHPVNQPTTTTTTPVNQPTTSTTPVNQPTTTTTTVNQPTTTTTSVNQPTTSTTPVNQPTTTTTPDKQPTTTTTTTTTSPVNQPTTTPVNQDTKTTTTTSSVKQVGGTPSSAWFPKAPRRRSRGARARPASVPPRGSAHPTTRRGHDRTSYKHEAGRARQSASPDVFCRFGEVFPHMRDICNYVANRAPGLRFSPLFLEWDTSNTLLGLRCPTQREARRLMEKLERGNATCGTQVWCFDSEAEAWKETVMSQKELERSYDLHLEQMTRRGEAVLARHYDKLADVEEELEELRKGRRNLSLEEFTERLRSRQALQDRQRELEMQRDEFLRRMEDALLRLKEARFARHFEAAARELRRQLATECARLASALPVYARRTDIVKTVKEHQACVIIGETGSGKSTQMAQFFLEEGVAGDGVVACTQPRKIAATSLAKHVAREMGCEEGDLVGYRVGMQARQTDATRILYMTDHVLLNECLQDPTLSRYSCVIIDEAHERSIYTDLLLGMLRACLRARPDLRLVITSATIKPDVFVRYFDGCPVVRVSGRVFPVDVEWQEPQPGCNSFDNYQEAAVRQAVHVHLHEARGDVLVFLTSPAETERCCQLFRDHLEGRVENYVVLPLHGRLQSDEQQRVFEPPPQGRRKVVFATNSAETSVTIPGVKFVIDTGLVKEMKYDPVRRISSLAVTLVSKSSARQRQGRAGRLGPGKCFRLYSEQDYNSMADDAVPEILKVHVGHAMLKLMELGVDPIEFEYVESPSPEALRAAMTSLEGLGAVVEGSLTERGRWIARMPFDPHYGALVYDAVLAGAGLEALVVAAASSGGPVFYRSGSATEKEAADKKKVRFCHEGGDQLTALNVFRAWHRVTERDKNRWCLTHAVNGKTLRAVRETTREVLNTLAKELNTRISFEFGDEKAVDETLGRLLFRALSTNLSHYLGHPKAGYAPVFKEQRVELHPSCALLPLGSQPEWLVYEQVMRTSKDFAMQVTPVEEEVVEQAVRDGWLQLDLQAARGRRLAVACCEAVGPQLFREVVGHRYALLRALEERLVAAHPGCVVVVEGRQEQLQLRVLSSPQQAAALAGSFTDLVPPLRAKFRAEESEECVGKRSEHSGVRAVIGAGGEVTDVLMPEEYTAVVVRCRPAAVQGLTEGEVALTLGRHGAIRECTKFFRKNSNSPLWGKVVFERREAAAAAVRESLERRPKEADPRKEATEEPDASNDLQLSVRPNVRVEARHGATFNAKLQWCRRPSKGFGYVSFTNVEDYMQAQRECALSGISVAGSRARVKPARREPNSLHVANLGQLVTEDVLRASFAEKLNLNPTEDLNKVVVVREQRSLDPEHRRTCERRLRHKIEEFAPRDSFCLEVREPRSERDVNFVAFCSFDNPEQGHAACVAIDNTSLVSQYGVVTMRPDIRSSLFVHADVFAYCGPRMQELKQELEGDQMRINIKTLKNKNVVVDLHSDSVAELAHVRARLQEAVKGEVVECDSSPASVALFSREGRKFLKDMMDRTRTLVLADTRLKTVSIHGPAQQRQIARTLLLQHLQQLSDYREDVQLRDGGRPPGLMKALMVKYGADLERLRAEAGLGAVTLTLRYHRLRLCGPRQAVKQATQAVEAVATGLAPEGATEPGEEQPECGACMCPVEGGDELCRLECCGHAYCRECLAQQVATAITDRTFPVLCVNEDCGGALAWRDFVNLSRWGLLSLPRLVGAAVAAHVQRHQQTLHYCLTPDCPAVYRTRGGDSGALFVCPECEARVCTACHEQYHEGLTCAMFRSAGRDGGVHAWLQQDASRRKICPSCTTPIEKVAGCNKVACVACRKVLCWVCLAVFNTEDDCYRHLRDKHGGYGI